MVCGPQKLPLMNWNSSVAALTTAIISTPPIVGVPSLVKCEAGPSARIRLPKPNRRSSAMNGGMRMTIRANVSRMPWTTPAAIVTPRTQAGSVR